MVAEHCKSLSDQYRVLLQSPDFIDHFDISNRQTYVQYLKTNQDNNSVLINAHEIETLPVQQTVKQADESAVVEQTTEQINESTTEAPPDDQAKKIPDENFIKVENYENDSECSNQESKASENENSESESSDISDDSVNIIHSQSSNKVARPIKQSIEEKSLDTNKVNKKNILDIVPRCRDINKGFDHLNGNVICNNKEQLKSFKFMYYDEFNLFNYRNTFYLCEDHTVFIIKDGNLVRNIVDGKTMLWRYYGEQLPKIMIKELPKIPENNIQRIQTTKDSKIPVDNIKEFPKLEAPKILENRIQKMQTAKDSKILVEDNKTAKKNTQEIKKTSSILKKQSLEDKIGTKPKVVTSKNVGSQNIVTKSFEKNYVIVITKKPRFVRQFLGTEWIGDDQVIKNIDEHKNKNFWFIANDNNSFSIFKYQNAKKNVYAFVCDDDKKLYHVQNDMLVPLVLNNVSWVWRWGVFENGKPVYN
jgi:hypothetical protein